MHIIKLNCRYLIGDEGPRDGDVRECVLHKISDVLYHYAAGQWVGDGDNSWEPST